MTALFDELIHSLRLDYDRTKNPFEPAVKFQGDNLNRNEYCDLKRLADEI